MQPVRALLEGPGRSWKVLEGPGFRGCSQRIRPQPRKTRSDSLVSFLTDDEPVVETMLPTVRLESGLGLSDFIRVQAWLKAANEPELVPEWARDPSLRHAAPGCYWFQMWKLNSPASFCKLLSG